MEGNGRRFCEWIDGLDVGGALRVGFGGESAQVEEGGGSILKRTLEEETGEQWVRIWRGNEVEWVEKKSKGCHSSG